MTTVTEPDKGTLLSRVKRGALLPGPSELRPDHEVAEHRERDEQHDEQQNMHELHMPVLRLEITIRDCHVDQLLTYR